MKKKVRLTDNDRYVRDVFAMFYPGEPLDQPITPVLQDLAARMLWAAIKASDQMDLVPRPSGPPTALWLLKQSVQVGFRYGRSRGLYDLVVRSVSVKYRTEFWSAREGLEF